VKTRCAVLLLLLALLSGRVWAGPTPLEEIRSLFEREMYRTGSPRLRAFLEKDPDSAEGHALLAEFHMAKEDWAAAEAAARRAVELDLEESRYWMLWSRARFEQGREESRAGRSSEAVRTRFAHAEVGFRRVRAIDPDHPDALWWIGWTKEWRGDHDIARQFYDSQILECPGRPGGYLRLGQLVANKADRTDDGKSAAAVKLRKEALVTFDLGLEKAGEDAEILYFRALALDKTGAREQALESLKRSTLADPDFVRSWVRLRKLVDETEVLVPFAVEVLGKHPTAAHPARLAGYHAIQREQLDGEEPWTRHEMALQYVLPSLEVHGDDEELYRIAFHAAQALIGEDPRRALRPAVAVDAFVRIHRAYAWSGDAANNLGYFFREVPDYEESLAWYLRSVERAPENQDILNDTGLIYLFHFPKEKEKGLPYFLKTVALVAEGEQKPERGYWDALENLCKHYWEVDRQPEKVLEYARMRYETTKGVKPYNMSQVAARFAEKARKRRGK
jgi:tetratricopeptide (TPR) repeat protein